MYLSNLKLIMETKKLGMRRYYSNTQFVKLQRALKEAVRINIIAF